MVAQAAQPRRDLIVIGDNGAGLAVGAEVLAGIETEAATQAKGPRPALAIASGVSLGGVLDHRNTVVAAHFQKRSQIARLAVEMDRQDGPGAWGDPGGDLRDVHRVGDRIDVHEYRRGADVT